MPPNKLTPGYNLRWESSRMMLPEHKIALIKRKRLQGMVKKPILDEHQLSELDYTVRNAMAKNQSLTLHYYQEGKILRFTGKAGSYNEKSDRQLRLRNEQGELQILNIDDIVDAEVELRLK